MMGYQQKPFDLETRGAVSLAIEQKNLEIGSLCEQPVAALATGINTSFLDRLYKPGNSGYPHTARVIVTEEVDSVFCFMPSQIL